MSVIDILKADYERFPRDQTYSIYAPDVYFKDPLNEFRGVERYRAMIQFMSRWFQDIKMDLHSIDLEDRTIRTSWCLHWTTPLPWRPRVSIPGRSELGLDENDRIISHVDHWDCSRLDVVKQHFG